MSYEIEYSKHAYYVTDQWQDRNYLAFVKTCSNNVSPRTPKPYYFRHGRGWEVIGEACRIGASVESGCWKPKNQWIKPEQYIGQWRTTLRRARPLKDFIGKFPNALFRIAALKNKLERYLEAKPEEEANKDHAMYCHNKIKEMTANTDSKETVFFQKLLTEFVVPVKSYEDVKEAMSLKYYLKETGLLYWVSLDL